MKVILKEDDVKLGDKGDVVNVAPGYARNYLIPKGVVVLATPGNVRQNEFLLQSQKKKLAKSQLSMQDIADKINACELVLKTDVGENGKLFGSITNIQIVAALKEAIDIEIDRKRVGLHEPIKMLGQYSISIKVYTGVNAILKVIVEDKNEKKAKPSKAVRAKSKPAPAEAEEEVLDMPAPEAEILVTPTPAPAEVLHVTDEPDKVTE